MAKIEIQKLEEQQRQALRIPQTPQSVHGWSIWECEPSTFEWSYDSTEKAYVYEGDVTVKTMDGEVQIGAGDFVTFPQGLDCTWVVKEKIRKVYQFQ